MCWNQYVSLNTFLFSTFVLGLMMYNDRYTPYKTTLTNNVFFYFFILSFASMQLIEYFLWKNINNKKAVQTISVWGQLLILLQPVASLLMLKNEGLKAVMLLAYVIPFGLLFLTSTKKYTTTVRNGHLHWDWMPFTVFTECAWLFFLFFSFVVNGYYPYFLAALALFVLSYWSYHKNGTMGSLWCWSINLFMFYFAVQLLIVLPFQEHGVC
jgi:hypothetical protein